MIGGIIAIFEMTTLMTTMRPRPIMRSAMVLFRRLSMPRLLYFKVANEQEFVEL